MIQGDPDRGNLPFLAPLPRFLGTKGGNYSFVLNLTTLHPVTYGAVNAGKPPLSFTS